MLKEKQVVRHTRLVGFFGQAASPPDVDISNLPAGLGIELVVIFETFCERSLTLDSTNCAKEIPALVLLILVNRFTRGASFIHILKLLVMHIISADGNLKVSIKKISVICYYH